MDSTIFRAYDIRGIVDKTLTAEDVFAIGKALGSVVREQGDDQLLIARDGRFSGPAFASALAAGVMATGCHVVDLGVVPTPLLYYATHVLNIRSGVMITGSHNPPDYNGLKIVIQGAALAEESIQALYHRIQRQAFSIGEGTYTKKQITEQYTAAVLNNIQLIRPLRIVIDAGNGVTGMIAPMLFRALGCEVHALYCEVDGSFPHHHPDPSQPENLRDLIRAVQDTEADIGLAFDGDGDRLGVVSSQGEIICPDRLLMLFARELLLTQPQAKIIFDVKCTNHLAPLIHALGGEPVMWKTGHSLIKAKMAEINAELAGEMSGHFFFKDRWYGFDDALYAGARLLEILAAQYDSSQQLFAAIPNSVNTPELKIIVAEEDKFTLMQQLITQVNFKQAHEVLTLDGLRVNFANGWGLVRPSNTTPCLVLRFEAINELVLNEIQRMFRELLLSVKPDWVLPF